MTQQIDSLPDAPNRGQDSATFNTDADNLLGSVDTFIEQTNAVATEVNTNTLAAASSAAASAASAAGASASATAASAASGVTAWVSGTTYAVGNVRFSPINFQSYRRITAGAGTTDPSADTTNWVVLNLPTIQIVNKTSTFTAGVVDKGTYFSCNGTFTVNLAAAATLTNGWYAYISNVGTGVITIDPSGSEVIQGEATWTLPLGGFALIGSFGSGIEVIMAGNKYINKIANAVASAATINLSTTNGDFVYITGTTPISSVTLNPGQRKRAAFASGGCQITHSSTLKCPMANNYISPSTFTGMVDFVGDNSGVVHVIPVNNKLRPYLKVTDQKATTTTGGTSSVGINTRVINTTNNNTITGASLASNQITLPAGSYCVEISAPCYAGNLNKLYLYNVTDAADALIGTSEYASSAGTSQTRSIVKGLLTITSTKVFEVRHYIQATATNGLGQPAGNSQVEVYTVAEFWKEA